MTKQRIGWPAYPPNAGWRDDDPGCRGATIWDYYAAAALQGCLASDQDQRLSPAKAASQAADMADALLTERNKRMEQGHE